MPPPAQHASTSSASTPGGSTPAASVPAASIRDASASAASSPPDIVARLRRALTTALSSRDMVAAAAIRSALAAVGNAEAVPVPDGSQPARARTGSEHVAGATAGLGAAEAARRHLSEADIAAIVLAEIAERHAAADQYDGLGRADQAERLRREAAALTTMTCVT
jgi:uncharacterized protein